jgi:hypothetical protein
MYLMNLHEKLLHEAAIERAERDLKITHDRNGNRCIIAPHPQPKYRTIITSEGVIWAHKS